MLSNQLDFNDPRKGWKCLQLLYVSSKIKISGLKLLHNSVFLARLGIDRAHLCVFCSCNSDSLHQIFFQCIFAENLWLFIMKQVDFCAVFKPL